MRVTDFSFKLSESLIAHCPVPERSSCRLLSSDGPADALTHGTLTDLLDKLNPGDLLVFNNVRMIPARLLGCKASDGKIGALIERMLGDKRTLAHIRASGAPEPGAGLLLGDDEGISAIMTACHGVLSEVEFNDECSVLDTLNSTGHMPLPPYIDRLDEDADRELYQTVYSEKPGAVVAPIAGPYLGELLLEGLCVKDTEMAFMTLHIGADIPQPVRVDTIEDHIMHSEYAEVPQDMVDAVLAVKARGNRMIAIGTISARSPESAARAAKNGLIELFSDDTQIFIYPGFQYEAVDALVMNSHPSGSTLIMLASAFAGYQHTMDAYKAAIEEKYRFFSYDDTMFTMYNPQTINERIGE